MSAAVCGVSLEFRWGVSGQCWHVGGMYGGVGGFVGMSVECFWGVDELLVGSRRVVNGFLVGVGIVLEGVQWIVGGLSVRY